MWIKAFTTGEHKDGAGIVTKFTRSDLDTMANTFAEKGLKVPACVGHPEHDSPAFGWFNQVRRVGDDLYMHLGEKQKTFAEWVRDGRYKYVSLALRPDLSIRHLGFLGGKAPAIAGLGELNKAEFSENLDGIRTFEFADYNVSRIKRVMQGIRELLIVKFGLEDADRAVSQWDVDAIGETEHAYSEPLHPIEEIVVTTSKTPEQLAAENTELQTRIAQLTSEGATTRSQLSALQFAQARTEDKTFLQGLGTKVLPGRVEFHADIMGILREKGKFTFAEGGEKSALEEYKGFLSSLPEQLTFGEQVTGERAAGTEADQAGPASKKIGQLVEQKMEKDRSLDFSSASKLVFSEHPDLAKDYNLELQVQG